MASANLFGADYPGSRNLVVFSTQIGGLAVATAGLTERQARIEGYDVVTGRAQATSKHPGNMPGAIPTSVKLVFSRDKERLLGDEASRDVCVGEIVNVISACIQNKMTAQEVSIFQMGTHPMPCASPIAYQIVNASEEALAEYWKDT